MRPITKLIIHCSATPPDMDIGADTIRTWHTRDNGWNDIGYHYVIRRDGRLEKGRADEVQGAHCAARDGNKASLGLCMVGGVKRGPHPKTGKPTLLVENNFTEEQWLTLELLVARLRKQYPGIDTILGHRDLDPGKECPSFSVRDWLKRAAVTPPAVWERPDFDKVISAVSSTEAPVGGLAVD